MPMNKTQTAERFEEMLDGVHTLAFAGTWGSKGRKVGGLSYDAQRGLADRIGQMGHAEFSQFMLTASPTDCFYIGEAANTARVVFFTNGIWSGFAGQDVPSGSSTCSWMVSKSLRINANFSEQQDKREFRSGCMLYSFPVSTSDTTPLFA